jgi:hypothetical protein
MPRTARRADRGARGTRPATGRPGGNRDRLPTAVCRDRAAEPSTGPARARPAVPQADTPWPVATPRSLSGHVHALSAVPRAGLRRVAGWCSRRLVPDRPST